MILTLMILAWLVPTLVTFRYTGYALNAELLKDGHSFDTVCHRCKCDDCGRERYGHWQHERAWQRSGCKNTQSTDECWHGMHPSAFLVGLIIAVLWPGVLTALAMTYTKRRLGLELSTQYFKPPPEIRTREERRARREEENKARVKELETRNAELEKELGIG